MFKMVSASLSPVRDRAAGKAQPYLQVSDLCVEPLELPQRSGQQSTRQTERLRSRQLGFYDYVPVE